LARLTLRFEKPPLLALFLDGRRLTFIDGTLLISRTNFGDLRFARFRRLSASIGNAPGHMRLQKCRQAQSLAAITYQFRLPCRHKQWRRDRRAMRGHRRDFVNLFNGASRLFDDAGNSAGTQTAIGTLP
jgi:hypothetical protein